LTNIQKVIYLKEMAKAKLIPKEKTEPKAEFKVLIKMNDQEFVAETNDIASFITSLKPTFLKTKVILTIEKEGKKCEKQVFGFKGRQLFRNPLFLRTFVSKLIFK